MSFIVLPDAFRSAYPERYRLLRAVEYVALENRVSRRLFTSTYGRFWSNLYAVLYRPDCLEYNLDPYSIYYVDPADIERMTGRKNATHDRRGDFGSVQSGEWDRNTPVASSPIQRLYMTHRFSESPFYRGLKQRYIGGNEWEDTDLHRAIIEDSFETNHEIQYTDWYEDIDELYELIRKGGYRAQHEIADRTYRTSGGFGIVDILANEITVDIGRDGAFRFVDGKHRLAIAKILDLDTVPVSIAVRHDLWADTVESNAEEAEKVGATDLTALSEHM